MEARLERHRAGERKDVANRIDRTGDDRTILIHDRNERDLIGGRSSLTVDVERHALNRDRLTGEVRLEATEDDVRDVDRDVSRGDRGRVLDGRNGSALDGDRRTGKPRLSSRARASVVRTRSRERNTEGARLEAEAEAVDLTDEVDIRRLVDVEFYVATRGVGTDEVTLDIHVDIVAFADEDAAREDGRVVTAISRERSRVRGAVDDSDDVAEVRSRDGTVDAPAEAVELHVLVGRVVREADAGELDRRVTDVLRGGAVRIER